MPSIGSPCYPVGVADIGYVGSTVDQELSLACRLFYPCKKTWNLPTVWISDFAYARGYMEFLFKMAPVSLKTLLAKWACTALTWVVGATKVLNVHHHAPLATLPGSLPVIIFSHGVAGTRNAYSSLCSALASNGYLVFAVEHSDGSASSARIPQAQPVQAGGVPAGASARRSVAGSAAGNDKVDRLGRVWRFYGGFGDKAAQVAKTDYRVNEVMAVHRLVKQLSEGSWPGLMQELPRHLALSLRGRIDLSRVAVAGHSYGGATAAAAAARHPELAAAITLDPWWDPLGQEWPVLNCWATSAPLLVIGSQDWNTPDVSGKLKCNGVNQERVLQAAAAGGGGALLLVADGSSHASFDDLQLLFRGMSWVLGTLLGVAPRLNAKKALEFNSWAMHHFLSTHILPSPPAKPIGSGAGAGAGKLANSSAVHVSCNGRAGFAADSGSPRARGSCGSEAVGQRTHEMSGRAVVVPVSEHHGRAYEQRLGLQAAILRVVPGDGR